MWEACRTAVTDIHIRVWRSGRAPGLGPGNGSSNLSILTNVGLW